MALAEHVIKPSIDAFNKAANGEMVIELYTADQLVPQGELFRAVQNGTIDAAQSDDDSMAAPVDVAVFGAYFPFASRYSLDVPVLWNWYGLKEIWEEAYSEVENVTWLSTGSWDPCNFATTKPSARSPTSRASGSTPSRPAAASWRSSAWCRSRCRTRTSRSRSRPASSTASAGRGITEDYTVGWADVTKYYLTNPISGAWAGSYFVNSEKWAEVPEHLKTLFQLSMDSSHYYRLHWYWWGEAQYRTKGGKLELTSIPEEEWAQVEQAALEFWDEIAEQSPRNAKVVAILKDYAATMKAAGPPYRPR